MVTVDGLEPLWLRCLWRGLVGHLVGGVSAKHLNDCMSGQESL